MRCSTCGAHNEDGASTCVECDEPLSTSNAEGANALQWLETIPTWLRWIIALPGVAIGGAIVIRQLEFAGLRDVSSGIIYPAALALTILAASQIAAYAAPSHRYHVGLVVATAELAVFLEGLLVVAVLDANQAPSLPTWTLVLYLVIPSIGAIASVASLGGSRSLADAPISMLNLSNSSVGVRWLIGVSLAVSAALAFGAVISAVSALLPAYLPVGAASLLTDVIGPGIVVATVADHAPARKMVAAWIAAGAFVITSAVSITFVVAYFARGGFARLLLFDETIFILFAFAAAVGAIFGLRAAADSREGSSIQDLVEPT
jgi:hypothetical protein